MKCKEENSYLCFSHNRKQEQALAVCACTTLAGTTLAGVSIAVND